MRDFLDPYGFKMPEILGSGDITSTFSAQYLAVYNAFVVKPTDVIATQQDTMVRALVSAGIWAKMDVFYIFANNNRTNGVINWINPGTFDAIEVNAPTFLAYRHFVGNGINQYLRTQFLPNPNGVNYTQNDSSTGIYIRNNVSENTYAFGVRDLGNRYLLCRPRGVGDSTNYIINTNAAASGVNSLDSRGLWIVDRPNAANQSLYINNALQDTEADASTGLSNIEVYILCYNLQGVATSFCTWQSAAFYLGASFDAIERGNFQTAIETYMDYVGAGVI